MKTITVVSHTICPTLLKPNSIVLDLGDNRGDFAGEMANRFQCRVYAVDASPRIFAQIPSGEQIQKFNMGICGEARPVTLNISSNPEATSISRLQGFHSFSLLRDKYADVLFVNRRCMSFFDYIITNFRIWVPRMFGFARRLLIGRGS